MISLGVDFRALFRRSAIYVDKILKGTNPAELPIQKTAPESPLPLQNIDISSNQLDMRASVGPAVHVESGPGQPQNIAFRSNRVSVLVCTTQALICGAGQCVAQNTTKVLNGVFDCE
jgi:hypothetical protein